MGKLGWIGFIVCLFSSYIDAVTLPDSSVFIGQSNSNLEGAKRGLTTGLRIELSPSTRLRAQYSRFTDAEIDIFVNSEALQTVAYDYSFFTLGAEVDLWTYDKFNFGTKFGVDISNTDITVNASNNQFELLNRFDSVPSVGLFINYRLSDKWSVGTELDYRTTNNNISDFSTVHFFINYHLDSASNKANELKKRNTRRYRQFARKPEASPIIQTAPTQQKQMILPEPENNTVTGNPEVFESKPAICIQLGAFKNKTNASARVHELRLYGLNVYLVKSDRSLFRVLTRGKDIELADAKKRAYELLGIEGFRITCPVVTGSSND